MVRAEKVVNTNGEWIKVEFKYNEAIVAKMNSISGARYNSVSHVWAVPYAQKDEFERKCEDFLVIWQSDDDIVAGGIPESEFSEYPTVPGYTITYDEDGNSVSSTGFKVMPYKYQVVGMNALLNRNFLILGDDMGLGKSSQLCTAMSMRRQRGDVKHGLILCPASLCFSWRDEISKFTDEPAFIMSGNMKKRCENYSYLWHNPDKWFFLIMSYETYRVDRLNLQYTDTKVGLEFMACDEAHRVKNPMSQIGDMIHHIPFRYKYFLTGTPIMNSPLDVFTFLKAGKVIDMYWFHFQRKYAVFGGYNQKEIVGYKNIKELRNLIQSHMLRRLKKDKLKNLPELSIKDMKVTMNPTQAKLYKAVKAEILEDLKDTSLDSVPSMLAKLMRLQQITDSPALIDGTEKSIKIDTLKDLLSDAVEQGKKVIVFSRFSKMIGILSEKFKVYNPAVITGDVSTKGNMSVEKAKIFVDMFDEDAQEQKMKELTSSDRQKQVYQFQENHTCKVMFATTASASVGLNLQAASLIIFLDLPWNYAIYEQAYSRAYRLGQKNNVQVINLLCENTIDEHVHHIVMTKKALSNTLVDKRVSDNTGAMRAKEFVLQLLSNMEVGA